MTLTIIAFLRYGGGELKNIRLKHLQGNKNSIAVCKQCDVLNYFYNAFDNIDEYADKLLEKYE